jgi:hypothetical protein
MAVPTLPLPEYRSVRIVRLLQQDRQYDGSDGVCRPPQVGDTGVIAHVYDHADPATIYMVECVNRDGYTIWAADFTADELELLD